MNTEWIGTRETAFFLLFILAGWLIGRLLKRLLLNLSKQEHIKSREPVYILLTTTARTVLLPCITAGAVAALKILPFDGSFANLAATLCSVLITISIAAILYIMTDTLSIPLKKVNCPQSGMDDMLFPILRKTVRVAIILLGAVQLAQILSNKPVTSIIAGLGVGGLAVALAAQETIKNFFGSLVIFGDKPFEIGERIKCTGVDGVIQEVGLRSTRIRTLEGHLMIVPNGELAHMSIENVSKRPHIRRFMRISITYNTPPEKVEEALAIVRGLLDNHEGMHPDFPPRVYFESYAACSLDLLVIYWYHPADYWTFLTFGEQFNLELLKRFNAAGIEFAFPTQTLHLANLPAFNAQPPLA